MMEPSIERIHVDLLSWRQDTHLHRMLHSVQCSVALSTGVLVIGVIITVVSLKDYEDDSKIFLVGPVLMTVGILGMTRAIIHHFKQRELRRSGRRRRRRQREGVANIRQRHESEAAICLTPPLGDELPYPDEPPPYDAVSAIGASVHVTMPALPPYEEGLSNPALDLNYAPPPAYDEIMGTPSVYATAATASHGEASGVAAPPPQQQQQPPKTEHDAEAPPEACGSQATSPQCASKSDHETAPSNQKACDTFACETELKGSQPCEDNS
ncbi:hypothetical protein CAPTEDRAFT_222294 [Capitella teleta]|uniref:Uncharacterized protein n=1 Tax=Capitella teleta TaxID=283909 RepID=R7TUC7_CAPTE|nr:hypothetical protein CAPTEDRAFT_222294 [Capitella teleta]|eukprot:ELT97192.1 hypothetical protein CAPTEDRAFT_222294 [Capitella teleta]